MARNIEGRLASQPLGSCCCGGAELRPQPRQEGCNSKPAEPAADSQARGVARGRRRGGWRRGLWPCGCGRRIETIGDPSPTRNCGWRPKQPQGAAEPTKYWLANLPADAGLQELVRLAQRRWIVERDYLEPKQELGLGILKGDRGGAFTIARHCASQLTGSWWRRGAEFRPRPAQESLSWRWPRRRRTLRRGAAAQSRQPCEAYSIASLRRGLVERLLRQLPCRPFCGAQRL